MSLITIILLFVMVFFAAFVQTLSGFGFSLVVMPLVTFAVGLHMAAPLVALAGLTLYAVNLARYHRRMNFGELARLAGASALGIPVGVWALIHVDESVIKAALGVTLIAYAAYELAWPSAMRLRGTRWAYLAGFAAGCLGGAYNTPGPPVVVYGALRQWARDEFRAVLQALFFINATLTVAVHFVTRHLTAPVWIFYASILPALLLGTAAGSRADSRVDKKHFRVLVSVMIAVLGVSLGLNAVWG